MLYHELYLLYIEAEIWVKIIKIQFLFISMCERRLNSIKNKFNQIIHQVILIL